MWIALGVFVDAGLWLCVAGGAVLRAAAGDVAMTRWMKMTLDELVSGLPAYARDLKANYVSLILENKELTPQQLWGTVVTSAIATRCQQLTGLALAHAAVELNPAVLEAAKGAAAIMAMNNIYFRFHHLTSNERHPLLPSKLRMSVLRGHSVEHVDFEMWCLVVSVIHGCEACVKSHEQMLQDKGATEDLISAVVRVAAVMHGIGVVLDAEHAAPTIMA